MADTPAPTAPDKKVHLAFLDGIRACAALYIVCHHAMIFGTVDYLGVHNGRDSWRTYDPDTSNKLATFISWLFHTFGQESVAVFICLSGFCLMIPVIRGRRLRDVKIDALPFFVKRAKRILPPYYASVALSLLMIATLIGTHTLGVWDISLDPNERQIVTPFDLSTHLLLVQDLFHPSNGRINGVLWSVAAEWRIYFLFPFLIYLWKRFGALFTVAATAIAAAVAHPLLPRIFKHLHLPIHVEPTMFVPEYFALFAFGALAAGITLTSSERIVALREKFPWGALAAIPLAATVLLLAPLGGRPLLDRVPDCFASSELLTNFLVGLGASGLMAGLAIGRWPGLRRALSTKALVFVGTISYSLYLIHYPIEGALMRYVVLPLGHSRATDGSIMIAVALPITIACAYIFYRAVERPSHLWATRRIAQNKAADPSPLRS